jgi:hypothetical protein
VCSPAAAESLASFRRRMVELKLDPTFTSTVGQTAAARGNRIGRFILDTFMDDGALVHQLNQVGSYDCAWTGSNEVQNYADNTGYQPVNDPLIVKNPGAPMKDPNRWQSLALDVFITQNGCVCVSVCHLRSPFVWPCVCAYRISS